MLNTAVFKTVLTMLVNTKVDLYSQPTWPTMIQLYIKQKFIH